MSILHYLPVPGSILTGLCVLLTVAIVIVNAIAGTACCTTRCSGISPVLIIIALIDYLISIQRSNSQEVSWLVLPAAWQLNLYPMIFATVPREMLTGVFTPPRAGCLRI